MHEPHSDAQAVCFQLWELIDACEIFAVKGIGELENVCSEGCQGVPINRELPGFVLNMRQANGGYRTFHVTIRDLGD